MPGMMKSLQLNLSEATEFLVWRQNYYRMPYL